MKPFYQDEWATIYHADCREVLRLLGAVDLVLTDPPYGLEFMGKEWDKLGAGVESTAKSAGGFGKDSATNENAYAAARIRYGKSVANMQEWHRLWAVEALNVLKPGGHAFVFGGTRTHHRLMSGLEDAGFEIRDCVMWVYGSGFPKSLDVSKAIDKAAGVKRERVGSKLELGVWNSKKGQPGSGEGWRRPWMQDLEVDAYHVTVPATNAAKEWNGWGTALKPAWEPIIVARKPLEGTVVENVLKHRTGALNIDGCRVGTGEDKTNGGCAGKGKIFNGGISQKGTTDFRVGRWPANLIHDGSEEVTELFPNTASGGYPPEGGQRSHVSTYGKPTKRGEPAFGSNSGSAARFFYTAKASGTDRGNRTDPALPLFGIDEEEFRNTHPTVKPLALMRYLVTLASREGQLIVDPFMGSGSTLVAAKQLRRHVIGIEKEESSCEIAARRLS